MIKKALLVVAFVSGLLALGAAQAGAPPEATQLLSEGHADEALSVIENYLAQNPRDVDARLARADTLVQLNRSADAARELQDLIQENPLQMAPYRQLGMIQLRQGDLLTARDTLEAVLRRQPTDTVARVALGDVYLALAGAAYDNALRSGKDDAMLGGKQRGVAQLLAGQYPSTDRVEDLSFAAPTPLDAVTPTAINLADASTHVDGITDAATNSAPDQILTLLKSWLAAWSAKDIEAYLACYADSYVPEFAKTRNDWAQGRRNTISAAHGLRVSASAPRLTVLDDQHARLRFEQHYRADLYDGISQKTLDLIKTEHGWQIVRERTD